MKSLGYVNHFAENEKVISGLCLPWSDFPPKIMKLYGVDKKSSKTEIKLSTFYYYKYPVLYLNSAKLAERTSDNKSRMGLIWSGKVDGERHYRWQKWHLD